MSARLPKDVLAKRAILYSEKTTDEERNAVADAYIEAERHGEALEFLEVTRDEGRLRTIRGAALQSGDTFLILRVAGISGEEVAPEDWRGLAKTAVRLGKFLDAYRALCEAGDEEEAETLRAEHMPDFQPFRPEGK